MEIRKAAPEDMDGIVPVFSHAREFMHTHGNPSQWAGRYPDKTDILRDIERENFYVCIENGRIEGCFALIIGEEPTYRIITDGNWASDNTYGTIHRIASMGNIKRLSDACFDFCKEKINHLRVDTHRDNIYMQRALWRNGFKKRGIIFQPDGTERLAYEYLAETG